MIRNHCLRALALLITEYASVYVDAHPDLIEEYLDEPDEPTANTVFTGGMCVLSTLMDRDADVPATALFFADTLSRMPIHEVAQVVSLPGSLPKWANLFGPVAFIVPDTGDEDARLTIEFAQNLFALLVLPALEPQRYIAYAMLLAQSSTLCDIEADASEES